MDSDFFEIWDEFTQTDGRNTQMPPDGRSEVIPTHKMSRAGLQKLFEDKLTAEATFNANLHRFVINFAYLPSMIPLVQLKPMTISELRCDTHHCGRVLIVRTFCQPIRIQAIQNAIEDINGDVDRISLYNGDFSLSPEQLLPKGAYLAIKEPFYKISVWGDNFTSSMVRVDHPSDLVILHTTHPLVPTAFTSQLADLNRSAMEWEYEGNIALQKGEFAIAVTLFSRGINGCKAPDVILRCTLLQHRALANFRLGCYEKAQADAEASICPNSHHQAQDLNFNAFQFAGLAAYELRNFKDAESQFRKALEVKCDDQNTLVELERVTSRLQEQMHGQYDFLKMSGDSSEELFRLDHASYTCITDVRPSSNRARGRGLFARQDIKAGDLILCEKAFSMAFESEQDDDEPDMMNLNSPKSYSRRNIRVSLFMRTIDSLRRNPKSARIFSDLAHDNVDSDEQSCVTYLTDDEYAINVFKTEAIIDKHCIDDTRVPPPDGFERERVGGDLSGSTGIWITASHINHACDGNACRAFLGDMLILRACKDIAQDEEILTRYITRGPSHAEADKVLWDIWQFRCDCKMCAVEQIEPEHQRRKRERIHTSAIMFVEQHDSLNILADEESIRMGIQLYGRLSETYDQAIFQKIPRLGLIIISDWLFGAFCDTSLPQAVIDRSRRFFTAMGYIMRIEGENLSVNMDDGYPTSVLTDAAMQTAYTYAALGRVKLGCQFQDFAIMMWIIIHGWLHGFEDVYQVLPYPEDYHQRLIFPFHGGIAVTLKPYESRPGNWRDSHSTQVTIFLFKVFQSRFAAAIMSQTKRPRKTYREDFPSDFDHSAEHCCASFPT